MLFLLFQLGADRYVLPARDVVEVLPLISVKVLPGAPAGIAGLVTYRGNAVPVIDLSILALGRPAVRRVSTRMLLIKYPNSHDDRRYLAIIAERATETIAKEPGDFQPTGVTSDVTRFLGPVAHDSRGLIQRVDVHALLSPRLRAALSIDESRDEQRVLTPTQDEAPGIGRAIA